MLGVHVNLTASPRQIANMDQARGLWRNSSLYYQVKSSVVYAARFLPSLHHLLSDIHPGPPAQLLWDQLEALTFP